MKVRNKEGYRILLILLFLFFIMSLIACTPQGTKSERKVTKQLSDLQVTACNTANDAGTCNTRLAELGIVLKEDCCQTLGKCC